MDDSGLGHQTRNLVRLLKPDRVIAIDFNFYNGFKQHPEWYKDENVSYIQGFIQDTQAKEIVDETDIILAAETFYNNNMVDMARSQSKLTLNQINYEFFDPLNNRALSLPGIILMPSYWHFEDMKLMCMNPERVSYLPPPTFIKDFDRVGVFNAERRGKRRFLHVAGRMAAHDRAGTKDLLEALKYSTADFELVIKVQVGEILMTDDPRVVMDYSFPEDERDLYLDFDVMVQPRRYAGLNLPMNEALASSLAVIMTNISPNNRILPQNWLVQSEQRGRFMARTMIDLYSANPIMLGNKLDQFARMSDDELLLAKSEARKIALNEFSPQAVLEKWTGLVSRLGL